MIKVVGSNRSRDSKSVTLTNLQGARLEVAVNTIRLPVKSRRRPLRRPQIMNNLVISVVGPKTRPHQWDTPFLIGPWSGSSIRTFSTTGQASCMFWSNSGAGLPWRWEMERPHASTFAMACPQRAIGSEARASPWMFSTLMERTKRWRASQSVKSFLFEAFLSSLYLYI
jgi:hypothetical protein